MVPRLNKEILLKALKRKWKKQNADSEGLWLESYPYYFKDLQYNLNGEISKEVKDEYYNGSGSELKWSKHNKKDIPPKMQAIHSSSAMTFNIFGNGYKKGNEHRVISIVNEKYGFPLGNYRLKYEKKLPALYSSSNIDVCLYSESTILLFEMKMTEWLLNKPSVISSSYITKQELYPNELYMPIKKLIENNLIEEASLKKDGRQYYTCKNNYFDAFQIIKHIYAIYNSIFQGIYNEKISNHPTVKLIIGIWTIPNELFIDDKKTYEKYKKIEQQMCQETKMFEGQLKDIISLFEKQLNVKFGVKIMTVKEIIDLLGKSKDPYLKRYI